MRRLPTSIVGRNHTILYIVIAVLYLASTFYFHQKAQAAAGIYEKINFQGKLVNDDGTNVADDDYSVTFTLYDHPSAGSNLWDEVQTVTVADGVFQVELGSVDSSISSVDFNTDTLYLGVKVESDDEMTPRIRFTAVPYAFMAEKVNGLTVTNTTGTFTLAAGKTLTVNNTITFEGTDTTTFTLPNATDTLVGLAATQTLSGKTLTAPRFVDGGFLADSSGNEILIFDTNASAVNEITITNAATGNGVSLAATGESNVALSIASKGTGALTLDSGTTGAVSLGTGNNAKTISIGTGTAGNTINIGTDNSTQDAINIGSALDNVAITGDQWSITDAGALTVQSCSGCGGGGSTLQQAYEAGETIAIDSTNGALVIDAVSGNFEIKSGEGGDTGDIRFHDGSADWLLVDESADTMTLGAAAGSGVTLGGSGVGSISITTDNNAANDIILTGGVTFNDELTMTLAGSENVSITNTTLNSASDTLSLSQTLTGDVNSDALSITVTNNNASDVTGTNYAFNLVNADNSSNTSVIDALALFSNDQATETLADGVIIRHNASSGTLTDALQIQNTTAGGTVTNAINIVETAGTISTGLNIGANLTTDINFADSSPLIAFADGGTLTINGGSDAMLTLADNGATGTLTVHTLALTTLSCTGCVDTTDIANGTIAAADLDTWTSEDGPADEDCLTYETSGGGDFEWQSCGGGGGTTNGSGVTYVTDTSDDFAIGASDTTAEFYFDIDGGSSNSVLYIGINESKNGGLTFYSSGAGETDPTITADSNGNLILSAPTGNVQVGSGTGNISVSLSGSDDFAITLGAGGQITVDASTTTNTTTTGVLDLNLISSASGDGINIDAAGANDSAADTIDGLDITVGTADTNDTIRGLFVDFNSSVDPSTGYVAQLRYNSNSTGLADALLQLNNNHASNSIVDGLNFNIAAGGMVDAIDASDPQIDNALNAGTNNIVLSNLQFSESASVITFEVISGGTDLITFGTSSGLTLLNGARNTKTITLTPEYPGAVLSAFYGANTDTNITGSMTSDIETTGSNNQRSYYHWERTTDATQHFYTVAVRYKLPKDFDGWAASNAIQVSYVTESATNTVSDLDVRVYLESDSDLSTTDAESLNNASTSWTTVTIDDSVLGEWDAADEGGIIYLRMGSASSNHVRVGDIQLNYLSKF